MLNQILSVLDSQKQTVIDIQRELVRIPALSPDNGGVGEKEKAEFLKKYLVSLGLKDIKEFNAPDSRVPCGYRPNLAIVVPGRDTSRTLWIIAHMDVVPPGNLASWNADPYELVVDGDILRGRGVLDNHQDLVSSLLVAKAIAAEKIAPPINFGMLFVSDEENGNKFGINYVLEKHGDIFKKQDLFFVPDYNETNKVIELAEKSIFWFKITVKGKQSHASRPDIGKNSFVASSAFAVKLRELYKLFPEKDSLFDFPASSFEPTKKEANVENINTIPEQDVFYVDCRVLPRYPFDDVDREIRKLGDEIVKEYGVSIDYEVVNKAPSAPMTPKDSEVVKRLEKAIQFVCGFQPGYIGMGGFTVGLPLRQKGYPVAVWNSAVAACPHQPNECSSIKATINDAKVMAHVLWGGD